MKSLGSVLAAGLFLVSGAFTVCADEAVVARSQGSALLLELAPKGVQIYVCEAEDNGFEWAFKAPATDLFDRQGRQIGTHGSGPSWKMNDGSGVVGEVVERADAAEHDAIPWLLLRAKSHEGARALSAAAYIRRTDTKGGAAPRAGCDASHLAERVRIRYSATYQFFGAADGN